ncbi:MAG: ribonuclease HII [Alphaproteobacteria bacterium]|nr:ribonuclease HII [Alphaproteobacteria bacterium]
MPDFEHESRFGRLEGKIICGVDEVGRGPLAGPVVAAAAILPLDMPSNLLSRIQDSKQMLRAEREAVCGLLKTRCTYAIAEASVQEIDQLNILWATMLAMQRAVEKLALQIDVALIDGNRAPKLSCQAFPIVEGDDKSLSIAAASIIAKVYRDDLMKSLSEKFPGYGWEHNAGYGTREHIEAIRCHGVTECHRESFAPVRLARAKSS